MEDPLSPTAGSRAGASRGPERLAAPAPAIADCWLTEPPGWVWELVGARGAAAPVPAMIGEGRARVVAGRIEDAVRMGASELRRATAALYGEVRRTISAGPAPFPVRFWNMLPHIQQPMQREPKQPHELESLPGELDRYMAFNLGRHDAFRDWAGGADRLAGVIPTATGVGHHGTDLFVYALCCQTPATPIENPRQLPAWRYSERFGPAPPCFARAGRMQLPDGRVAMFIGGTASVRGEDSFAPDDLDQQLAETLRNLDAVIEAGLGPVEGGGARCLVEARAYCLRAEDVPAVQAAAIARFAGLERLEICQADICRRELRVEIEGLVVAERQPDGARAVPDAVSVLRAGLA